jgi:serine O-acetyltransferase
MVLLIHRVANALWRWHVPLLPKLLKITNRIVFGVVLPPSVQVGSGVPFSHQGLGTVIHKAVKIGNGAIISTGVTIGGRSGLAGAPVIGQGALIGTNAKVLGPVSVGEFASIGANAVVLHDIPPFAVEVNVPARVIRIKRPQDIPRYEVYE